MEFRKIILSAGIAVLLLLNVLSGCTPAENKKEQEPVPAEIKETTAGDWRVTNEWKQNEGAKELSFLLTADGETEDWNQAEDLSETSWSISAEYDFQKQDGVSYGRMLFGDRFGNIAMAVTLKWNAGTKKLRVTADQFVPKGWRDLYTGTEIETSSDTPFKLKVNYAPGNESADITVSQGKTELLKTKTDKISEWAYPMFERFGLGTHGGTTAITNISPRVVKKPVEEKKEANEEIKTQDNVSTEDWLIQENAVHNLEDGKSVVIIDGYGEVKVWNKAVTLGDAWSLETKVTFGKTQQGACTARFGLGPDIGGGTPGLITVEYSGSRQVEAFMEVFTSGWQRVGGTDDWIDCMNNTISVKLYKMSGVNRICLDLIDHGTLLESLVSDEIPAEQMESIRHFALMVYSSEVKYSDFAFKNSDEGNELPEIVEKVYPKIMDFEVGDPIPCEDWEENPAAVYYNDPQFGPALAIDSRGDTFCYYRGKLEGNWKLEARIDYGTYYGSVASTRIALANGAHDMTGLLTFYCSKANGQIRLNTESRLGDTWTTEYLYDWSAGEKSVAVTVERTGDATLHVTMKGPDTGIVYVDQEIEMHNDALNRTTAIGLGTLSSVTRWSGIRMEP